MARLADIWTNGAYSKKVKNAQNIADKTTGGAGYADAQNQNLQFAKNTASGWNAQAQGEARANGLGKAQRAAYLAGVGADSVDRNDMYSAAESAQKAARDVANKQVEEQMQQAANAEDALMGAIDTTGSGLKTSAALMPALEKNAINNMSSKDREELVKRVTAGEKREDVENAIKQRKKESLYNSPLYRGTRWLGNILFGTNFGGN